MIVRNLFPRDSSAPHSHALPTLCRSARYTCTKTYQDMSMPRSNSLVSRWMSNNGSDSRSLRKLPRTERVRLGAFARASSSGSRFR